ncbi:MAG: DNA replication/repair protein RecF [Clostridia bacterium]|nr:DNA replication/repair protein RecF [Clostridia bacterium]
MFFRELEIENFRNYEHQKISFNEKVNVITGKNAQGKTNLIEALYIMSLARSFRTPRDNELIRFGSDLARVRALVSRDGEDSEIEIGLMKNKKSIRVDGVNLRKISDFIDNVLIVVFSPDDLRIVKEDPSKRRGFMDRELCQMKPVYYDDLSNYKRILNQRNALLKDRNPDENMLDVWDEELVIRGARIMSERAGFVKMLDRISSGIHFSISDGRENLRACYEPSVKIPEDADISQIRDLFRNELRTRRTGDIDRRMTTAGPHRDDIKIEIDGTDVRKYGSQGQQRSAALSMKLAEIDLIKEETGTDPILLLDDVLSELDSSRQKKLIKSFEDIQIFITTTELDRDIMSAIKESAEFSVEGGHAERLR